MKYSVLNELDSHFVIKHPDGSTFNVAKKGLKKTAIDKIRALTPSVKMADGGIVGASDSDFDNPENIAADEAFLKDNTPEPEVDPATMIGQGPMSDAEKQEVARNQALMAQAQAPDDTAAQGPSIASVDQNAQPQTIPQANGTQPQAASPNQVPQPAAMMPNQATQQPQAQQPISQMIPGMNGVASALKQGAINSQEYGNQVANIYQDVADKQKAIDDQTSKNLADIKQKRDQAQQAYASGKVDPNRFWSNLGTGQKIASIIGVFLGGLGARDGRPNYALQILNDHIDKDIEAQKSDINKNQNLYSQYVKQYGDEQRASIATKLQLMSSAQAQIAKAAAQNGSKQAMVNAQLGIAEFQRQAAPLEMKLAQLNTMRQLVGANGSGSGGIPTNQVPASVLADPKTAGRLVDVGGKSYLARTEDEAKQLRTENEKADSVLNQIDSLQQLGKSALIPGSRANNIAHAIRSRLAAEIPQLSGIGRLNEREIELALEQIKNPTSFMQLVGGGARNNQSIKTIIDEIENDRANKLIGYKPLRTVQ